MLQPCASSLQPVTMCMQLRILAYGKGSVIVKDVKLAAEEAGIKVVVEECAHFAANLFARGSYTPADAQVCSLASDLDNNPNPNPNPSPNPNPDPDPNPITPIPTPTPTLSLTLTLTTLTLTTDPE